MNPTSVCHPRILSIEDDPVLGAYVHEQLGRSGFDVTWCQNGREGLEIACRQAFDVVLMDILLPGMDGLAVLTRLRQSHSTPVVLMSALGAEADRISGFRLGADDYLPKPFNPRELVARINAVLRRRPRSLPGAPVEDDEMVSFGGVTLNLATRQLTRDGEEQPLTTGEFALLKVLVQHPRQPLSRDKLMELARGREYGVFDRSIDVQISRLRKLVEDEPAKPRYIQTVWGFGYVFVPDGNHNGGAAGK